MTQVHEPPLRSRFAQPAAICALMIAAVALLAAPAYALEPSELLLIVNSNVPQSAELAEFYASARGVPADRILALNLPESEEISFERFEQDVIPAVRRHLREKGLRETVQCIVTFYGVPLRISGHAPTPAEKEELAKTRDELNELTPRIERSVRRVETLATRAQASFTPGRGRDLPQLGQRADAAMSQVMRTAIAERGEVAESLLRELLPRIDELVGPAAVARHFKDEAMTRLASPQEAARWPQRREEIERAATTISELEVRRFDPAARKRTIEIAGEFLGLFGRAQALHGQAQYLSNDATAAAFDSELALLWWGYYPRSALLNNPLYHATAGLQAPPVVMVSRLDAPRPPLVRKLIESSLAVEQQGLSGQVVIDSRGLMVSPGARRPRPGASSAAAGPATRPEDAYATFDQSLRDLATLIEQRTSMPLSHQSTGDLLAARAIEQPIALYCGWYSLRKYVPPGPLVPGAVGYHVASLEMLTLHTPGEPGWAAGLLDDGAGATVGPVAEPYLAAFPRPDEFFPLLLTGRLTLAEVYWKTSPTVSWMMCLVGDPLYRPFAAAPQVQVDALPESLRRAATPAAPAPRATRPTTAPGRTAAMPAAP